MNELMLHNMDTNVDARRAYESPTCRIRETEMVYMYLQTISDWHENPGEWN